ncbi:MAG: hypothetical protein C4550_03300 [Nitrospiraceae bacterium]|nr:MAG: hypothetical protein C4550_03300 [Nitrospiraceae bacterium]
MKNIFRLKTLLSSVAAALLVFVASNVSHSGNIIVKPGGFDHFAVQLPEKVRAGEGVIVKLQAYDMHDNLITNFAETGKEFKVSVSGSAQVQPSILKAVSFMGGSAGITIAGNKAEIVVLSIFEAGGTVPLVTKEIAILPNKLDHFFIQSPPAVMAGNKFDIKVIARDAYSNPVADTDIETKNIKLALAGTAGLKIVNADMVFRNGVSIATLMAEKTGESAIEVHDTATGSRGASAAFKVMSAGLSYFKIHAPKEAVAGEQFEVTISTFDAFDNPLDNYSSSGRGVNISSTGQAKVSPSFIGQSEFKNGRAVVKMRYEKAEEISIVASESGMSQQGKSTAVRINPAAPERFVVVTPDSAVAGQKFRIKVEVYDKFKNIVRNYNLIGNDVYLNASGAGMLSPKRVHASEFVNGVASVDAMYDKAESFAVSASIAPRKEERKITVKEKKEVSVPAAVKSPDKPAPPKPKAIEKPKAEKPAAVEGKPSVKAAEKREKKSKQITVAKEEGKPSAKAAEKKESVKEKKTSERFFEISKVSLIEAKNKAMIIMNMNAPKGHLEYKNRTETIDGKEWIILSLKPAVNKTKNLWKFKSAFIKEIHMEDDKASGALNIRIETMGKQVTFDINKVKDSLIISISAINS